MSLFSRRPKAPTPLPLDKLLRWSSEVEDAAENGMISWEALEDLSQDLGTPIEKLLAAIATTGTVQLESENPTSFVVCAGGCQAAGAVSLLADLAQCRQEREDEGISSFDIDVRRCLGRCQSGAVVEVRTPDGTAVLERVDSPTLLSTVGELLD